MTAPTHAAGLRSPEYVVLVVTQALSTVGDEVAALALSVVVFHRTGSALLSALTFAAGNVSWLVGAPLLAGLGDRFPRRSVLVGADAFRCLAAATLALPLPTAALLVLIGVLALGAPPFNSARSALLPDILGAEGYAAGQALAMSILTGASFAGFAAGGLAIAAVGPRSALLFDAGTYALSAIGLRLLLAARPAPQASTPATDPANEPRDGGWAIVMGNPVARWSLGLAAVSLALLGASSRIAVPWSAQLGHGPGLAGLLASADTVGAAVGAFAVARLTERSRRRLLVPSAVVSFGLLVPLLGVSTPVLSVVLLSAAGLCAGFQLTLNQAFALAIPAAARARAFGVAGTLINVVPAAAALGAGALAGIVLPSRVVGLAGVLGMAAVAGFALRRPAAMTAGASEQALTPETTESPSEELVAAG